MYRLESQISLGTERRGCFEPPSDDYPPNYNVECPDILPTELQGYEPSVEAAQHESPLEHPDSKTGKRFVMGTRMQTTGHGTNSKMKHKLPSCSFHNIDCSKEGKHVKTMSQGRNIILVERTTLSNIILVERTTLSNLTQP